MLCSRFEEPILTLKCVAHILIGLGQLKIVQKFCSVGQNFLKTFFLIKINSSIRMDFNSSKIIQLTTPQLTQILRQLGYPTAQVYPHAKVHIQLEPFQFQNLGLSSVALPTSHFSPMPYSSGAPTVESIISTTYPSQFKSSRINPDFVQNLADKLQISEKDLIDVIHDPKSEPIAKLTRGLNQIYGDMVTPPLTENEVLELFKITLPSYP
jgi:hypothetical protein